MTKPTDVEQIIDELKYYSFVDEAGRDCVSIKGALPTITKALTKAKEEGDKLILCSRIGIHTCRLGAVHIPDELMEQIKALTPDHG